MTTKLKVRVYGDPCLRVKSDSVDSVGPAEKILMKAMIETMYQEGGIGLAAPQVGINKRLLVGDVGEGPFVIINPKITDEVGMCSMEEGCLSVPEVTVEVNRPEKIAISFLDQNGDEINCDYDGLMARVILHEIDHLDGKLIPDYADKERLTKIEQQLKEISEGRARTSKDDKNSKPKSRL